MAELKKSILIISATQNGLESTQTYLLNRGWRAMVTHDLKDALNYLMIHQPDTVLVCMDHPNKNVSMLPRLILERVRCCVIATTQRATLENYNILHQTGCEYKVFPPTSGPAVERAMNKFIKKTNALLNIRPDSETKRSGISPKMFRVNLNKEGISNVIDYANFEVRQRIEDSEIGLRGLLDQTLEPGQISEERLKSDHVLVQGTERIISEIIEPKGTDQPAQLGWAPIKKTSQITCMLIESKSFQGYLVAALGEDCHLDHGFTTMIHRHLLKFLEEQGEKVTASDIFNISIKPVEFLDWAREYADFLRKSLHKNNEIAFAFFPLEGVRASYQPSISDDMVSVPVTELFGDSKIGFNLYIFFPANKKYVLYTPAGSVFYNHQQERLVNRGITHIHIRRNDLSELNRYRAQKYFNMIVDEYATSGAAPASALPA